MNQTLTNPLGLTNIDKFNELADFVLNSRHQSAIGCFYGFSGYGKTVAAVQAANKHHAVYLSIGDSWTKTSFINKIAEATQSPIKRTKAETMEGIIKRLNGVSTLMLIDEFDFAVAKNFAEIVREIHDHTSTPIIIIGEEKLPAKLEYLERFHNRVIKWEAAAPASVDDAKKIIEYYYKEITFADDLIEHITSRSQGILRRIHTNAALCVEHANLHGLKKLDLNDCKDIKFFTGAVKARSLGV